MIYSGLRRPFTEEFGIAWHEVNLNIEIIMLYRNRRETQAWGNLLHFEIIHIHVQHALMVNMRQEFGMRRNAKDIPWLPAKTPRQPRDAEAGIIPFVELMLERK